MGKGRDKRKKAKGSQGGQGGVKTARKTERNEEKAARRAERRAEVRNSAMPEWYCWTSPLASSLFRLQGGEDDLDALLAKFALEDKQRNEPQVEHDAPPPSARVYASFTPVNPAQVRAHPLHRTVTPPAIRDHRQ